MIYQPPARRVGLLVALVALAVLAASAPASAQGGKGYDTEFGFSFGAVKAKGLEAPDYAQPQGGNVIVADETAGGAFSVPVGGGTAKQLGKVKRAAGIAIAPAGFGSYAGQVFVLAPAGGNAKAPCEVERIDKSGTVSTFAKLPDAGSLGGGKATECRDLEFGPSGGPYAGKLYAVTNGNAALYEIDASGKARAFGVYDKPLSWEVANVGFAPANDSKAPGAMLLSVRPRMESAAKVGRIVTIDKNGKMADNPYLVGFIRPTGFGFAPAGFGSYAGVFFIADAGKWASDNQGAHDGKVFRVYKGVAREYATGMVDPTCLKFAGRTMVLCDPSAHGKRGAGALITIAPMY